MTPEELQKVRDDWHWIYNEDGTLDEAKVLAELSDFKFIMEQASEVYYTITCGKLSKPNYYAQSVLGVASECNDNDIREAVKDVLDYIASGKTVEEARREWSV